jgi:hypothetical protein
MDIGKTFYARDRNDWRKWLGAYFDKEKEIWLIYPSKESGKPCLFNAQTGSASEDSTGKTGTFKHPGDSRYL